MIFTEIANIVFKECIKPEGFIASPLDQDNYKRVWARDASLAGLTAIATKHKEGIQALKNSVLFLAKYQSNHGQIPSNVSLDESHVSFGSLAGRVDATSWWIISACWTMQFFPEEKEKLIPQIEKAITILECLEMNGRGFIYTPLGGNWADEYISTGYTLYDQLLRLWGLRAYYKITQKKEIKSKATALEKLILDNFSFYNSPKGTEYHPTAYAKAFEPIPYWPSQFSPAGYDKRWDMAANALVMILGLNKRVADLEKYVEHLMSLFQSGLVPVFYPIIQPDDDQWSLLKNNFNFNFKNHPFQFHNGGSWPIFSGLMALGFTLNNHDVIAKKILSAHHDQFINCDTTRIFSEYWDIRKGSPEGVSKLCFSASGYLLMNVSLSNTIEIKKELLCWEIS